MTKTVKTRAKELSKERGGELTSEEHYKLRNEIHEEQIHKITELSKVTSGVASLLTKQNVGSSIGTAITA